MISLLSAAAAVGWVGFFPISLPFHPLPPLLHPTSGKNRAPRPLLGSARPPYVQKERNWAGGALISRSKERERVIAV